MFINTDEKLIRKSGRKAKKTSLQEFKEIILAVIDKSCCTEYGYFSMSQFLSVLPQVKKDISKIQFDFENSFIEPEDWMGHINLVGFHELHIPFLGCMAGGDWEEPVFFIIYHDGKKFRGYVPVCGNVFNRDTNEAIGNDEDADYEFLAKEEVEYIPEETELDYHWPSIKKDILFRIEVQE